MTTVGLPPAAADLQHTISAPATCTYSTADYLERLLPHSAPSKLQSNTQASQAVKRQPNSGNKKLARAARPAAPSCDSRTSSKGSLELNERQKHILLTGIINDTLKCLTDAAKARSTLSRESAKKPTFRPSTSLSLSERASPRRHTPLQPISGNRSKPLAPPNRSNPSVEESKGEDEGLKAQAKCAHMALRFLVSIQAKGVKRSASPSLQLDKGMSALIHKCVALGFYDLAVQQLQSLRKRLIDLIEAEKGLADATIPTLSQFQGRAEVKVNAGSVVELVGYSSVANESPLLPLIVTSQLQVLKILAAIGVDNHELLVDQLEMSNCASPASLILQQVQPEKSETAQKAAGELEALAQLLLKIAQRSSSRKNAKQVLSLEVLAIRLRVTWWDLSKHCMDFAQDIGSPLTRALNTYHARSVESKQSRYQTISDAFKTVRHLLPSSSIGGEPAFLAIYQKLAEYARVAGQDKDSAQWLREAHNYTGVTASPFQLCLLSCQSATSHLRTCLDLNSYCIKPTLLSDAAQHLAGDLQGNAEMLDELLIVSSSLRKTICFFCLKSKRDPGMGNEAVPPETLRLCLTLQILCIKYFVRYLGNAPDEGKCQSSLFRQRHRLRMLAPLIKPTIEGTSTLARVMVKCGTYEWDLMTNALSHCLMFAQSLENIRRNADLPDAAESYVPGYSLLSQPHWQRYLELRRMEGDRGESQKCLKTAIDILRLTTPEEQSRNSMLTKLEHYGRLFEDLRDYRSALEVYGNLLELHKLLGTIRLVAGVAKSQATHAAFEYNEETKLLTRALQSFMRVAKTCEHGNMLFYDFESLRLDERLCLLSYQFDLLIQKICSNNQSNKYSTDLENISTVVLSVASRERFPVRRLSTVVTLMYLRLTQPFLVKESVLLPLLAEYTDEALSPSNTYDSDLQSFSRQLLDSLYLLKIMEKQDIDNSAIEGVLGKWLTTLHHLRGAESLGSQVYDVTIWQLQLELLVDYLEFQGLHSLRILALKVYILLHEKSERAEAPLKASKLVQLGLQQARLGYISVARSNLQRAQQEMQHMDSNLVITIQWHLASAEVDLESQDYEGCHNHLRLVRATISEISEKDQRLQSSHDRAQVLGLISDADMVQSRIAVAEGHTYEALLFARLSVKGYDKIWMSLERRNCSIEADTTTVADESRSDSLQNAPSTLSIAEPCPVTSILSKHAALQKAAFWTLVPRLVGGLLTLASRFAHACLFSETDYYHEETEKIVQAAHTPRLRCRHVVSYAQHTFHSGDVEKATNLLDCGFQKLSDASEDRETALLYAQLASLNIFAGFRQKSRITLDKAERILLRLRTRMDPEDVQCKSTDVQRVEEALGAMSLNGGTRKSRPSRKAQDLPQQKSVKSKAKLKECSAMPDEFFEIELQSLLRDEGDVLRQKALLEMTQGNLDLASDALKLANVKYCCRNGSVNQAILEAETQTSRAMQALAAHPVFNIVAESAISHPSVSKSKLSHTATCTAHGAEKPRQRQRTAKTPSRQPKAITLDVTEGYTQALRSAQKSLNDTLNVAQKHVSVNTLYHMLNLLLKSTIIDAAVPSQLSNFPPSGTFLALVTELGRMAAMSQKKIAIEMEQHVLQKGDLRAHSLRETSHQYLVTGIENLDLANFQREQVDSIPTSWDVVSMTLSQSKEAIVVTKIRRQEGPFILRIPLNRQNLPDCDALSFGFTEAKQELQEIITLANQSSQDARSQDTKKAKLDWWNVRSDLDTRLKDLVTNLETVWLGGFRGIFSHHQADPSYLARFQMSLQGILQKHLPSRSKPGKSKTEAWITLNSHVIQLFVALGCPVEEIDIDDQVLDLLYFVVDILQFNGERNAYDEIEFDSMVVETLDALRQYHRAVDQEVNCEPARHTILILDKHLHAFPWESLPCLRGLSISRLPSLSCLRRRVLLQQEQQSKRQGSELKDAGILADAQDGTFILNPSSDLTNTQENFEETLQSLPGWDGLTQSAPSEEQFKNYLEDSSIFLYFGHGSGGQYIRSRTINKLPKCAVSLLMGCSSGHLQEAGLYEPYGKPLDYMHAGCPAVVANLWDVTDKDIDRFAQSVLEKWGLFLKKTETVPSYGKNGKGKGKGNGKAVKEVAKVGQERNGPISLNEAVAQSRDACVLKYLNGAAPVIYGVPVYLK